MRPYRATASRTPDPSGLHPTATGSDTTAAIRATSPTSESISPTVSGSPSPTLDPTTTPEADLPATKATPCGAKVKLPKISLPRFRGDLVKWTPFWDAYQSAIHLNPDLTDIDKFNYLRSLLDHTAYDAIAGLMLSAANYKQAITILE